MIPRNPPRLLVDPKALLTHVAEQLGQHLPARRSFATDGLAAMILERGRLRSSTQLSGLGTAEELGRRALDELQDLAIFHLHTPWPMTADGRATYSWAELDGALLRLAFRPRDGSAGIELAPFPLR